MGARPTAPEWRGSADVWLIATAGGIVRMPFDMKRFSYGAFEVMVDV